MPLIVKTALISLLVASIANAVPEVTESLGHIQIAAEDNAAPWSNSDGTGEANELVKEIFKAVNIEVDFTVVPYARCKSMVINGQTVACFSMSESTEAKNAISFSEGPLFTCSVELFARKDLSSKYKTEKDLPKGMRLGVVKGYEYPRPLTKKISENFFEVIEVNSESQLLKMLDKSRLDFAIITFTESKRLILFDQVKEENLKFKSFAKLGDMNAYIGFSNLHPQGKWALQKFNEGQRILQKRLPSNSTRKFRNKS